MSATLGKVCRLREKCMNRLKKLFKLHILPISIMLIMLFAAWEARGEGYYHSCEYPDRQTELTALACNVAFESKGESRAGQLAVAFVTLNRVEHERFPDNIIDVVYQPKQFSWHTDGKSDRVYDLKAWTNSLHIASYVLGISDLDYKYVDITDGSLYYHTTSIKPDWSCEKNKVLTIDNHVFYHTDLKKHEKC